MSRCGNSVLSVKYWFFGRAMRPAARFSIWRSREVAWSISAIARRSILLIFSLQLIREDRGRSDGFGLYWIVCHNRSPLQYVPTRDRYSIGATKKSFERSARLIAAGKSLWARVRTRARAGEENGREIRTKYTWQTSHMSMWERERDLQRCPPDMSATLLEETREWERERDYAPRVSSPEADYSRFARRDGGACPIRTRMALKRGFINGKCSRKSLWQTRKTRWQDCEKFEKIVELVQIFAN